MNMERIEIGHRVELNTRKKGWVPGTVVGLRALRGRGAGNYEVSITVDGGGDYTANVSYGRYEAKGFIRFVGVADTEAVRVAALERQQREENRERVKSERANVGVEALEKWKLREGDQVTIEYRGGICRNETVTGVNYATGKVGVSIPTNMSVEERERMEVAFYVLNEAAGTNVRVPTERDCRWIPANQVVGVVSRA